MFASVPPAHHRSRSDARSGGPVPAFVASRIEPPGGAVHDDVVPKVGHRLGDCRIRAEAMPFPHRDRIEGALGPMPNALHLPHLRGTGIRAVTVRGAAGFAERAPSLRTAAHEAAHVVQQSRGVTPSAHGPAEREASRVADTVARGDRVDAAALGPASAVQAERDGDEMTEENEARRVDAIIEAALGRRYLRELGDGLEKGRLDELRKRLKSGALSIEDAIDLTIRASIFSSIEKEIFEGLEQTKADPDAKSLFAQHGCEVFWSRADLDAARDAWLERFETAYTEDPATVRRWVIGQHEAGVEKELDAMDQPETLARHTGTSEALGVLIDAAREAQVQRACAREAMRRFTTHADLGAGVESLSWQNAFVAVGRTSGYRRFSESKSKYEGGKKRKIEIDEETYSFPKEIAPPGLSGHGRATEVDVFKISNEASEWNKDARPGKYHGEYSWMQDYAAAFGFVQPYTGGSEDRMPVRTSTYTPTDAAQPLGYFEEKWHWSYYPIADAWIEFIRAHEAGIQALLYDEWAKSGKKKHYAGLMKDERWRDYVYNVNRDPASVLW